MKVTDKMVDRFLSWKLPEDFHPDGGISFSPYFNVEYNAKQGNPPQRHEPIGTNLLNADQAKAMLEHVIGSALQSEMPETNVVLKVYASKDHGVVAHINANGYGPGHFGLLLADCIRHVARAFNVDEGEVYEYVKREMSMPSTKIEGGRKQ